MRNSFEFCSQYISCKDCPYDEGCFVEEFYELLERVKPQLSAVLQHGADKYPVRSWKTKSVEHHFSHMAEHFDNLASKQTNDEDSGQPQYAHIVLRAMMALALENMGNE